MENKKFYFITVYAGYNEYGPYDGRCWGFYDNWDDANEVLHHNITDLNEGIYPYGIIEEYRMGISGYNFRRWFYKYNSNTNCYDMAEEPKELKHLCSFSIG